MDKAICSNASNQTEVFRNLLLVRSKIMRLKFIQFSFLGILLLQTLAVYGQTKICDVKLSVFSAQKTEYPLSTPVKNAAATIVNLSDNKVVAAQIVGGNPFLLKTFRRTI